MLFLTLRNLVSIFFSGDDVTTTHAWLCYSNCMHGMFSTTIMLCSSSSSSSTLLALAITGAGCAYIYLFTTNSHLPHLLSWSWLWELRARLYRSTVLYTSSMSIYSLLYRGRETRCKVGWVGIYRGGRTWVNERKKSDVKN